MKKYFLILLFPLVVASALNAQIFTIGPENDFYDLKEAFEYINSSGFNMGDVILQITSNIELTQTTVLQESGYSGSYYSSITIYPVNTGLTISGDINETLLELRGCANLTIDGRVNQTGAADLTIVNKNDARTASTIMFSSSAKNNTIRYCNIQGSGRGSGVGILFFSTSSETGAGNNNNAIEHNTITTASPDNRPTYAILSSGSDGKENSGNIIRYNNFFNFLNKTVSSAAIFLSSNTTDWTIKDNSFYETTTFSPTTNVAYSIIRIDNPSGAGFIIEGNYIGGSEAFCKGVTWKKTNGNNAFNAINLNVGSSPASQVSNNVIQNISWANSSDAEWTAINVSGGSVAIGAERLGNTIEDITANSQALYGISVNSSATVNIKNNFISNIYNVSTNSSASITGLSINGADGTFNAGENFINLTVNPPSANPKVYGVRILNGSTTTLSNNIISLKGNAPAEIFGIADETATNVNLLFNTVYIAGTPAAGSQSSYALHISSNASTKDIRNNILVNARSRATGNHYAIFISAGTPATIDYNDYYTSGTGGILGNIGGTNQTTLDDIKAATAKDANSYSIDPAFNSPDDYTPSASISVPGINITEISHDFYYSARSSSPVIGALVLGCNNPTSGGTIASSSNSGCAPFDPSMLTSAAPAAGHMGKLEYKWQFSVTSSSEGFVDIPGATSLIYNPGELAKNTWFKRVAKAACQSNWNEAKESNVLAMTVNPKPTVEIKGNLTTCDSTILTVETNALSPTYNWYMSSFEQKNPASSILIKPHNNGVYTVKVTDGTTLCSAMSAALTTTVQLLPTANITGDLSSSRTRNTTLTANTSASSPTFIWYKDNIEITGQTSSTLVVTESGNYTFKVIDGISLCEQTSPVSTVTITKSL